MKPRRRRLADAAKQVFIVAHKEDTTELETAFRSEGFEVEAIRGPYTDEQAGYCAQIRCLVNHANAWKRVAAEPGPCIVVEADFVPVHGFGSLPSALPDRPDDARVGMAWLYSGSATLYGVDQDGFPFGNAGTLVAYELTPRVASILLDFFAREMAYPSPGEYRPFDTYLGIYLRKERGCRNYLPIYQYGEHGGIANAEHYSRHRRAWHQADALFGRLAFLPLYARKSAIRYRLIRLRAHIHGWMRLLTLRYYDPRPTNPQSSASSLQMSWLAVSRMLHVARVPPQ